MATSRTTFGALLNTITTAANAVTSTLSTIDTSIGMASTAIDDAARRQAARSKLDQESYKDTITMEKSMELSLQEESILDWIDGDSGRADRYQANYDRLRKLLD